MDEKKPSTTDILAKIRSQKAAAAVALTESGSKEPPQVAVTSIVEESLPTASQTAAAPVVAAPAAKPGSTKDIMAAIRAKAAGASVASSPALSSVAVDGVAEAAKPAVVAGPRPSVQDMLKAVREGKGGAVASVAVKPLIVAPPIPAKPAMASKKVEQPRRGFLMTALAVACVPFLSAFNLAWTCLGAVTGIATLGTARFMFPNVLVEPPSKFKVGPLSDYPLNSVSNKWKDQYGVWIVHTDQYEGRNLIFALASVCTHLGCTPSWLDGEQKFKCPCHGSGFYMTGVNFEGPAPRPLERVGIRIAEGMLEVDKSVKFQEEMGQWGDAASYHELA